MAAVTAPADEVAWFRIDDRCGDATVRRGAMRLATRLGFDEGRAAEVGIVATELTTNLARHAGGGAVALARLQGSVTAGIGIVAMDTGPGLSDVDLAVRDGYSTRGTLGVGLGAVQRLSTTLDLYTSPGRGTVIAASLWPDGPGDNDSDLAALTRPMTNEVTCGDTCATLGDGLRHILVVADGLGHGPLAALASREASRALDNLDVNPTDLLATMHRYMNHTRGAAVAVAAIDHSRHVVRFAGIGNVSAWIVTDGDRHGMISQPGIVGHQYRPPKEATYDLPPGSVVVLHSDGLTDKWQPDRYAGLWARSPIVIAGVLLRDAGVRHDDASILIARSPK